MDSSIMSRMHNEITCPYCRMDFGGFKISNDQVQYLDIMWSYEAGMIVDCRQPQHVLQNILSIDRNQNPTFNEEFSKKLEELKEKFYSKPDDVNKDTHEWKDYFTAFCHCMNWGYIENDEEEFDRNSMSTEKLKEMYDNGTNLYEALRYYIIPVKDEEVVNEPQEKIQEIKEQSKKLSLVDRIKLFLKWS